MISDGLDGESGRLEILGQSQVLQLLEARWKLRGFPLRSDGTVGRSPVRQTNSIFINTSLMLFAVMALRMRSFSSASKQLVLTGNTIDK